MSGDKQGTLEAIVRLGVLFSERRNGGRIIDCDVVRLVDIAKKLHRLDEIDCNEGLSAAQERRESDLTGEAVRIASAYNLKLRRQGDPRGLPMYLHTEDFWYPESSGVGIPWL